MFVPPAFAETDPRRLDELIEQARLITLVTNGAQGLFASHLPMLWDPARRILTGHLARANPHPRRAGGEAMAILTGPEAYVSPGWYPSKAADARQVPTWNYEAVHLTGRLEWFEDPERLRDTVAALSDRHEAGRAEPWRIGDAPEAYVRKLLNGVVGVALHVTRVEAIRKLSQNRSPEDRAGVIAGLEASPDPRDRLVAARMRD